MISTCQSDSNHSPVAKRVKLIDRSQIPELKQVDTSVLQNVTAYDQQEFESGVLQQVNSALEEHNKRQIVEIRERLRSTDDDLKLAESELHRMEFTLNELLNRYVEAALQTSEVRKIKSIELGIENKMKQMDILKLRKESLLSKLSSLQNSYHSVSIGGGAQNVSSPLSAPQSTSSCARDNVPVSSRSLTRPSHSHESSLMKRIERLRRQSHTDDANLDLFQRRLRRNQKLNSLLKELDRIRGDSEPIQRESQPDGEFYIPEDLWSKLYDYQRSGVRWLYQLHQRKVGGILGDEMGLGKTIQVIAFLAGLHHSALRAHNSADLSGANRPFSVLIICPATVLRQWMTEFHLWYPPMRIALLHPTGSGYGKPVCLIRSMAHYPGSVLLTTYNTFVTFQDALISPDIIWSYVILDEGHKIKNPEAEVTGVAKRFSTPHRLILSGSPIQNNLRELWSIFDFVCPGRLGPLQEFMQQFAIPITQGGYSTASPLQVETAYRCACTLRDILTPYLLRRLKSEVRLQLPKKSEQVLFCRLTNYQRKLYQEFTESQACKDLLNGKGNVFTALILLRKLCNHPDLVTGGPKEQAFLGQVPEEKHVETSANITGFGWKKFGCPRRSSKMLVVSSLLQNWVSQGHKVLVFSQSRRMLNLLENLVKCFEFNYVRMDGSTPVWQRPTLIENFNRPNDPSASDNVSIFLLTTRVGGLGINLTAASRVLIYDPDWNPTTDLQARERAWRIGQKQEVVIYRLLTSGTIEEKIYQRQIFKQFLTNRILRNPRQQRFFKTNDLQELLSFEDTQSAGENFTPETTTYVRSEGLGHTVTRFFSKSSGNRFDLLLQKRLTTATSVSDSDESPDDYSSAVCQQQATDLQESVESNDRRHELRILARELSRRIAEGRVSDGDSIQAKLKRLQRRKRRNLSEGVRIDGQRIALISRRSVYDTGDHTNSRTVSHSLPITAVDGRSQDDFVSTVLAGTADGSSVRSTSTFLEHINSVRSKLDPDLQAEAKHVAEQALESLMRSSSKCSSMCDQSALRPSFGELHCAKSSFVWKRKRKNTISSDPKSVFTSNCSLQKLPHVSHVISHDELLDKLTNKDRADSSFCALETQRLVATCLRAVCMEARSHDPVSVPLSTSSLSHPSFGTIKNRFLWNSNERQSHGYVAFVHSLRQSAFAGCAPSFCNGDTDLPLSNHLVSGHVRFSSAVLIELIRARCSSRNHDPSGSSPAPFPPTSVRQMQRLVVDLIRLLSGPDPVTSGVLAAKFRTLLSGTPSTTDKAYDALDARHFRTVLRSVANRIPSSSGSPAISARVNDKWILRERYRDVSCYLSTHLMSCEGSPD